MKRKLLYGLLIALSLVIGFILFRDITNHDLNQENPYEYDLSEVNAIDSSWIKYREVKRISTGGDTPKSIAYKGGLLGIAYESHLQVIDTSGQEIFLISTQAPATCVAFAPDGNIFLGYRDRILTFSQEGSRIDEWASMDSSAYITSIAFTEDRVFLADAGNHEVLIYDHEGERIHSFNGKVPGKNEHGFIVPSPYFDVAVDPENQLWVANTGLQSMENYTDQGVFRSYWGKPSFAVDGFIGCCNPAQFCILPDGSFVTCEKGSVRIKVYTPAGELESVVATPGDFSLDSEPPDIAVDDTGAIYALDITRKMIRKFVRNG